jgi:hypothetical protein
MAKGTENSQVTATPGQLLPLDSARWRLGVVWFPVCGLIFLILIGQSVGGVYGNELQRVWGWALPNFLPTLALMLSVFAADALKPYKDVLFVRKSFCLLAVGLSIFYLCALLVSILVQPLLQMFRTNGEGGLAVKIELLETSNLWLAPLQGLVIVSLGVLFFLKEGARKPK